MSWETIIDYRVANRVKTNSEGRENKIKKTSRVVGFDKKKKRGGECSSQK